MLSSFLLPILLWLQVPAAEAPGPALQWSAGRALTWADFRGRPRPTERLAALTASNIDVRLACRDNRVSYTVQAVFLPAESWVRNTPEAKATLLRHEQLHFDITELYARKLRQRLAQLKPTCEQLQPHFQNTTQAVFAEWKREEARYDEETNHGLLPEPQRAWAEAVQQQLQALAHLASPS